MLSIIVLLLSSILFSTPIVAYVWDSSLDANSSGVSCFPIISEAGASRQGGIKVYLEDLVLYDGDKSLDLKIPILIFRYEDILNFTTIPSFVEFDRGYASNYSSNNLNWDNYFLKNLVDFEENKFILDLYEGYNEIDESRLYNGFLVASEDNSNYEAVLPVFDSGMYCVYIAPPIDKDISIISAPVSIRYSRLYSTDMLYAHYCETKYTIGVGLLLLAYLVHNTLRFIKGRQLGIENMPIISKTVIFYLLVPLLSLISLEWLIIFIEIHCNLNSRKIRFFEYFRLTNEWTQLNWKILLRFYVLLFTMGYGVIYYRRGASRTCNKMPKRATNIALSLLISNIILSNAETAFNKYDTYLMAYECLALYEDSIRSIFSICSFGSFIFPIIWYLVSFIYYFKTRNIIRKLPPTSTSIEGIDANTRIMKAFKQSSFVIFISPSFSGLLWFSSLSLKTMYTVINVLFRSDLNIHEKSFSRKALIHSVNISNHMMQLTEYSLRSMRANWPGAIKIYLTIGLLYLIWIRIDNALLVEDEKKDFKE